MDSVTPTRWSLAAASTFLIVFLVLRTGDSTPSSSVCVGQFGAVLTPEQGADLHSLLGPRSRKPFGELATPQTIGTEQVDAPQQVDSSTSEEHEGGRESPQRLESRHQRELINPSSSQSSSSSFSLEKSVSILTGFGGRSLPGSTSGFELRKWLAARTQRGGKAVRSWGATHAPATAGTLASRAAAAWHKWRASNSLWWRTRSGEGQGGALPPKPVEATTSTTTITDTATSTPSIFPSLTDTFVSGNRTAASLFLVVDRWTQAIGSQGVAAYPAAPSMDPSMPFTAVANNVTQMNTKLGIGGAPGMLGAANGDYGVTQWANTASAYRTPGPCTAFSSSSLEINVFTPADFNLRLNYPNTLTVTLVLQNNIFLAVNQSLTFDRRFSCTFLTSALTANCPTGYTIHYASDNFAALFINGANNIVSLNVSYSHGITAKSPACKGTAMGLEYNIVSTVCPAVFVYKSYGIQIGMGTVFGRVDAIRSLNVRLDHLKITSAVYDFPSGYGCIKVAFCGVPMNMTMGNVLITNNDVYGVDSPILVLGGSSGVGVYNNYVHNWGFSGIRIGDKVTELFTAAYTEVSQNLVIGKAVNMSQGGDTAGLYWNTHWFGPGMVARCNYVHNGHHCMYLDNFSSDLRIKGGACVNQRDGIKFNTGKKNVVEDVVMKNTSREHAWISCLFWNATNCNRRLGIYYNNQRTKYYNSDFFKQTYPWWSTVCSSTTANNGRACNPPGSLDAVTTANCSSMPVENVVDLVTVQMLKTGAPLLTYAFCSNYNLTAVPDLNNYSAVAVPNAADAKFLDFDANDLGLQPDSPVYAARPGFLSCPRKYAGPQKFSYNSYLWNFNIPKPAMYDAILTMSTVSVMDNSLVPKEA